MKRLLLLLAAVACFIVATTPVRAHAFLDHADPKVGSEGASPSVVSLWFTQEIEAAFSTVKVFDACGKEIDKKDATVSPTDKSKVTLSVPPLVSGIYTVKWSVVSVDTHHTTGTFTFTVK